MNKEKIVKRVDISSPKSWQAMLCATIWCTEDMAGYAYGIEVEDLPDGKHASWDNMTRAADAFDTVNEIAQVNQRGWQFIELAYFIFVNRYNSNVELVPDPEDNVFGYMSVSEFLHVVEMVNALDAFYCIYRIAIGNGA